MGRRSASSYVQGPGLEIVKGTASCGYGTIVPDCWPGVAVAQISSVNAFQSFPSVCGLCLEVGYQFTRLAGHCKPQRRHSIYLHSSL